MKYNIELWVKDDSDLVVKLYFRNVDYQKIQRTLIILEEDHYDPLTSGNYSNQTTICGFKEERIQRFYATLVEESKKEKEK